MAKNGLVIKLAKVMSEVQYLQKKGYNSFHKYRYATEADVNEKVREELAKQNVVMLPSMLAHSMREHTNRSGAIEYITMVDMEFRFIDGDTGEELVIRMSGEGQDAGDKGIYKAISGAQKYALMKAFMIPTGDDPEGDEEVDRRNHTQPSEKPEKPVKTGKPSEAQLKRLYAISKAQALGDGVIKGYMKETYGAESSKDLTIDQYRTLCEALEGGKVKAWGEAMETKTT